uniref:BHLH domain-containing protein n=2 Tax=Meloidogyne enterolobii TaxID=390850 RepID=A0A6V7UGQ1_MELEN|nr:unnamed protein product [Meloidogyne enterolobii]
MLRLFLIIIVLKIKMKPQINNQKQRNSKLNKNSDSIALKQTFQKLRQLVPCYPLERRVSKLEVLRAAIRYISILEYSLGQRSVPIGCKIIKICEIH